MPNLALYIEKAIRVFFVIHSSCANYSSFLDSELNDVFYFDDWSNIRHFTDDDIRSRRRIT